MFSWTTEPVTAFRGRWMINENENENLGDFSICRSLSAVSTAVGRLEKERAAGMEAVSRLELLLAHIGPGSK